MEQKVLQRGLLIGTALGLLLGAAFVGPTGDWSWLVFTLTLGWALGLGIALDFNPRTKRTPTREE